MSNNRYRYSPSGELNNNQLNADIERFCDQMDGTSIGADIRNMYENGTSYEAICDRLGWDVNDYEEE